MYSNCAPIAVAINKGVVWPTSLVRANAAASYHLLHIVLYILSVKPEIQIIVNNIV